MLTAVLFKSKERFIPFKKEIEERGIKCIVLDFEEYEWINFDFQKIDFVIYYPSFRFSSNHPLALHEIYDNLEFISRCYPHLKIYPDPKLARYYNDKYCQYLFLNKHDYPIPSTFPLYSKKSLKIADEQLGYPMVVKNRFGAGGRSVSKIDNFRQLESLFEISNLNFIQKGTIPFVMEKLRRRNFYFQLVKEKKMEYPLLSYPIMAQKYITMDRDIKTVVGNCRVVEAHWRIQAHQDQWKVNIDGGGIGEWSRIPEKAIELSERLARDLEARWINIDLIPSNGEFLITEFSPVWHHYAFKEKPTFVYKDDYNIDMPLEVSLNLEKIIVDSMVGAVGGK